jgi:hypothetical protein
MTEARKEVNGFRSWVTKEACQIQRANKIYSANASQMWNLGERVVSWQDTMGLFSPTTHKSLPIISQNNDLCFFPIPYHLKRKTFKFCFEVTIIFIFFFFFGGTRVLIQGLHLEPLHQSYFCDGIFQDRVLRTVWTGWLWTEILLISVSWVARNIGRSHRCLVILCIFWDISL